MVEYCLLSPRCCPLICSRCRLPHFVAMLDGIGKAMAFQMAKKGMNVLLISRTETKLVDAEAELKARYPSVSVEHLAIDYSDFNATLQVSSVLCTVDAPFRSHHSPLSNDPRCFLHTTAGCRARCSSFAR